MLQIYQSDGYHKTVGEVISITYTRDRCDNSRLERTHVIPVMNHCKVEIISLHDYLVV